MLRYANQAPEAVFQPDGIGFIAISAKHFLFDAALSGLNLEKGDFQEITLAPAKYLVQTALHQPDAETSMILHRLLVRR